MKSENLIHIKFEYDSALESKKDMLASEIDLLKISQILSRYKELRSKELDIKEGIEKKIKVLKMDLGRLQNLLPEVKIPSILKPERIPTKAEEKEKPEEFVKEEGKSKIEMELEEIQRKLSSLQI